MSAIQYPTAPVQGQEKSEAGRTWRWDSSVPTPQGGAWVLVPVSTSDVDLASQKAQAAAQAAQDARDARDEAQAIAENVGTTFVRTDTAAQGLTTQQKTNAKTNLDLSNVNNTSDVNKPISTATQGALDLKAPASSLNKGGVGLGNVDNTSDANKPVSTAQAAAIGAKFDKTGGTITGDLYVSKNTPVVRLQSTGYEAAALVAQVGVKSRWALYLGDSLAGADHFRVFRYNDTGAQVDAPFAIRRDTGAVYVSTTLDVSGPLSAQQGVTATWSYFGLNGGPPVAESDSAYRHRIWRSDTAIAGTSAYLYTEHVPGVSVNARFYVHGSMYTMANGGQGSSPGGWVATSDNRVKYQVRTIQDALDKVDKLGGYTYIRQDMADLSGHMPVMAGLLAQEVLAVLPEAVIVPKNYDPVKNQGDLLSLDSYGVLGLLVQAIKELRSEVKTLQLKLKESP